MKLFFKNQIQCITHVQTTGSNSLEIISNQDYDIWYCMIYQVRNHIQLKKNHLYYNLLSRCILHTILRKTEPDNNSLSRGIEKFWNLCPIFAIFTCFHHFHMLKPFWRLFLPYSTSSCTVDEKWKGSRVKISRSH